MLGFIFHSKKNSIDSFFECFFFFNSVSLFFLSFTHTHERERERERESVCVGVCVCECVCVQRRKMRNDRVVLTPIINQSKHSTAWLSVTIKDLFLLHLPHWSLLLLLLHHLLLPRPPPLLTPSTNPSDRGVSARMMFHRWSSVGGTIVADHSIPPCFHW